MILGAIREAVGKETSQREKTARPTGVLFVCTGNACRSQMAEGFARACAPEGVKIYSAGTLAAGVHPLAVEAMAEIGIDISEQTSNRIDEIPANQIDIVVTLCDDAAQRCPVFPGEVRRTHWPIKDPIYAVGTHEEQLAVFRTARDDIGALVRRLMGELASASSG